MMERRVFLSLPVRVVDGVGKTQCGAPGPTEDKPFLDSQELPIEGVPRH